MDCPSWPISPLNPNSFTYVGKPLPTSEPPPNAVEVLAAGFLVVASVLVVVVAVWVGKLFRCK